MKEMTGGRAEVWGCSRVGPKPRLDDHMPNLG
jgi:hypothetical protein